MDLLAEGQWSKGNDPIPASFLGSESGAAAPPYFPVRMKFYGRRTGWTVVGKTKRTRGGEKSGWLVIGLGQGRPEEYSRHAKLRLRLVRYNCRDC